MTAFLCLCLWFPLSQGTESYWKTWCFLCTSEESSHTAGMPPSNHHRLACRFSKRNSRERNRHGFKYTYSINIHRRFISSSKHMVTERWSSFVRKIGWPAESHKWKLDSRIHKSLKAWSPTTVTHIVITRSGRNFFFLHWYWDFFFQTVGKKMSRIHIYIYILV